MKTVRKNREKAIIWWNTLDVSRQEYLKELYYKKDFPITGRIIEEIYKKLKDNGY